MRVTLTREQKRAAANDADRAYIEAGPGTGKTAVASERYGVIRYRGGRDSRGVVALSFARSARGELQTRVRERWGSSALRWPHKASTLDSLHRALISHLLRKEEIRWPGHHKELTVLDTWRGQPGARPLTPEFLYCRVATLNGRTVSTAGVHIGRAIYGYGNKDPHEEMLASGICTHDEIRDVLRDALSDTELREVIADYLRRTARAVIVDEVFDGNRLDLEIVKVAAEANIPTTLIGDPWQALYEFRGAEPELVPNVMRALGFRKFPVTESFRFQTDEMKGLADRLRAGSAVRVASGTPAGQDVVLAAQWRPLWDISDDVLPLAFGQINNRTDAAMALILQPLTSVRFGPLPRAALEAKVALGLDPDSSSDEVSDALAPVLNRLARGTLEDASAALGLLRTILSDIGGRRIPALSTAEEEKRIQMLMALSRRLGRSRLVPGMTIHQAKGREWSRVAVHLTPGQQARLAGGLMQEQPGDRAIYVAMTRARERVRLV